MYFVNECSPIFTYNNRATLKPGVVPDEHAVAYSYGSQPALLPGEPPLKKRPICIIPTYKEQTLSPAARIFFGVHHPIQYNVKVKDLGSVHPEYIQILLDNWRTENETNTIQFPEITAEGAAKPEASDEAGPAPAHDASTDPPP